MEIESCDSMEVKDETRHCSNLFDGSLSRNVKDNVCFVTKSNYKGWLEVKLAKTSLVTKVVLLSKANGSFVAFLVFKWDPKLSILLFFPQRSLSYFCRFDLFMQRPDNSPKM